MFRHVFARIQGAPLRKSALAEGRQPQNMLLHSVVFGHVPQNSLIIPGFLCQYQKKPQNSGKSASCACKSRFAQKRTPPVPGIPVQAGASVFRAFYADAFRTPAVFVPDALPTVPQECVARPAL